MNVMGNLSLYELPHSMAVQNLFLHLPEPCMIQPKADMPN